MIYILIAIAIFYVIYFFVSIFNSHSKLEKLYDKYQAVVNSRKLTGAEIAFLGKNKLDLPIKVAMRKGKLTDGYSFKDRIVILSEGVCNSKSISSAGIVAHELGHAIQHHNGSFLFKLVRFLNKFCNIFCCFALPLVVIAGIMYLINVYTNIANILLIIGIVLLLINILKNILEIPLENNASWLGVQFLQDYDLVEGRNLKKVRKLLKVASKTYMADFFRQLIPLKRK